jgi:hypothetical protein
MHGPKNGTRDIGIPGSGPSLEQPIPPGAAGLSSTQPSNEDNPSEHSPRASPTPQSELYRDVLVECNKLIEGYRKGKIPKPTVYVDIYSKLITVLGDDRAKCDAAFGSFVAAVESHDSESAMAARRGARAGERGIASRSPTPDVDNGQSDEEPVTKKLKVNESAFAWFGTKTGKLTALSDNLAKTLELIEAYTVDPKSTKRSLTNSPDCPEFPDSEWKNVIAGKAVNLDAVLSGQLSTTNDDLKVERFGELEFSFGAVEPTKTVKNGGEWSIAWNKTVRATAYAFPHRFQELTGYGEYITSLFAVTHPSFHARVISFDKAVRKRVGSVRNLELSEYEKFADLKIAHVDPVGVSAYAGSSSKDDSGRNRKRSRNWKKSEPCNKWNEGTCTQAESDCRRQHVCNKCGKGGHKGKECRKTT